jgi:ADP-heptose:LPS heptosyltransferase
MPRLQALTDYLDARSRRRPRDGEPSGVLFISSGGLGDTILLAHVMERFMALAKNDEPVTLLLRRDGAKTAFLMPSRITPLVVDFNRLRKDRAYRRDTARDLYEANYRLAVTLDYLRHPHLDEFLLGAAAARETIGMVVRPWAKYEKALNRNRALFTRQFDSGPLLLDKVVRWARFADWATGTKQPLPVCRIPDERLPAPTVADTPYVMCQGFSAVKGKQVSPALFAKAFDALPPDWNIVMTGAPGEDKANPEFADLLARHNVSYDDDTFKGLVPKLRAAKLAISVDTALMHLAIAAGTPTIGLASAAYVNEIVPYADEITPPNARFVYHDLPCRSCLGNCHLPPEDGRFPCIARLDGDEITNAVRQMTGFA